MKLLDLLDQLENELESASNVLLTNKVMVNKDSMLDLLDEIRSAVPADIKEAKKILDDSTKIKQAAQRDAKQHDEGSKSAEGIPGRYEQHHEARIRRSRNHFERREKRSE
jgi:hypothetical protein